MKKSVFISFSLVMFVVLSAFSVHKFYVSIYQIQYAQEKKMLQITSRIFVDDLNTVLKRKYNKKTFLGEPNESQEDVALMEKYLLEHISIKINGHAKPIRYLSKEMEGNVLICYYNSKDISKIKSFEIQNTALLELSEDQQNIVQTTIYGKKQNLLMTTDNVKGLLNF
ncbi:DUF6702 family protein [Flavobacterium humi]|uniref:Peptidase E n=1 Tax=Flavobacterium humi TaxID=2562683 RepID=A0A4Z0L9A3_9FLAO|nr:DUF6702 family protein [Flavobacterium humi]TGD57744.1 hypothetical protein E4635_11245 [Flavobacterium humi]